MKTWQFFRMALHNLGRDGQRVWVAFLCILFGVMSLTALNLLSVSLERVMLVEPQANLGGDLWAGRFEATNLTQTEWQDLAALQQAGTITQFMLEAENSDIVLRQPGSGELQLVSLGIGIDPQVYPFSGQLTIQDPPGARLADLLQGDGDLLITRDLAQEKSIHTGDTLLVSDLKVGMPVEMVVRGVVEQTPDGQGDRLYYTLDAALKLSTASQEPGAAAEFATDKVLILAPDIPLAQAALEEHGWWVITTLDMADLSRNNQMFIETCLRGAGILGLLVGGIGVANTMVVLLRRRMTQMAVLKVLGYRQADLNAVFLLEAAILGSLGSGVGLVLGILVSKSLIGLSGRMTNMLLEDPISPALLLGAGSAGLLTTLIFAVLALVSAGETRPAALLRGETLVLERPSYVKLAVALLGLGLAFATLTCLVVGSLLNGLIVLAIAAGGLVGLGGLLSGILWVVARLLPVWGRPTLKMARRSLQRRGLRLVFSMIAMFAGVVTLAFGTIVVKDGQRALAERTIEVTGANLTIVAPAGQEAALEQALEQEQASVEAIATTTEVLKIEQVDPPPDGGDAIPAQVNGFSSPAGYTLTGAEWGSVPDGVYVPDYMDIPFGSQVRLTLVDGSQHQLKVVGSYVQLDYAIHFRWLDGLLMPAELSRSLQMPDTVTYDLRVPPGGLESAVARLGEALPQATVLNLEAYLTRDAQAYHDLFIFAAAMAGLALLAGALLLANTVGLAMLDRRYEMGVLKAVGYARRHILASLAAEYSLVAVLVSGLGLLAVRGFLFAWATQNALVEKLFLRDTLADFGIVLGSTLLTLLTVLIVSWGAVHSSPLVVLNEQG
ncbi:MAG TPA: FtsX-like permease family protein [Anaerolineales bacterium]|nr:FtsX-like permease family protein [Anaerolineales bacterium]